MSKVKVKTPRCEYEKGHLREVEKRIDEAYEFYLYSYKKELEEFNRKYDEVSAEWNKKGTSEDGPDYQCWMDSLIMDFESEDFVGTCGYRDEEIEEASEKEKEYYWKYVDEVCREDIWVHGVYRKVVFEWIFDEQYWKNKTSALAEAAIYIHTGRGGGKRTDEKYDIDKYLRDKKREIL